MLLSHAQLVQAMYSCLVVIWSLVTRQVSTGQDMHIFFLLHDSNKRPNCANPFVTRYKNRAGLGSTPRNSKNTKVCRFRYGCSTEDIKLQLLKESATQINYK